jgi:phosphatidylserine decarboxylase
MRIDKAGVPFIAAAVIPAAAFAAARRYGLAASCAALGGFFAYFFRDPDRVVPEAANVVVSPADGRIMHAGPADPATSPPGPWLQITIFLSPLDVHINRAPVAGRVTRIEYRPGRFLPAYDARAGENELNEIWVDADGTPIVFRQVVGILARRIVCRIAEGQQVERGERIGLMKFGSRMDVFVPPGTRLCVEPGQSVVAGETIVAVLGGTDAA